MQQAIYIIDDDRMARESLKWLIESARLPVREFEGGLAFLEAFDPGMSGCVLLDVRMPDVNGMELHARLGELGATLPVIIVTGHADVGMVVRAMIRSRAERLTRREREVMRRYWTRCRTRLLPAYRKWIISTRVFIRV